MGIIEDKYKKFKSQEKDVWLDKMVWSKGQKMFNSGSYDKFIKSDSMPEIPPIKNTEDYFKFVDKVSETFILWAKKIDNTYEESDYIDMGKDIKGFFGEWFSYRVAEDTIRILTENKDYVIRYMSPNLIDEDDNGIDFTAIINDEPSVIQVKWWNKWVIKNKNRKDDEYLSEKIFQSLGYEGQVAGYIDLTPEPKENMFFFWLGPEEDVYRIINKNPRIKGRVVVFGEDTWNFSVNGKDEYFWSNLWDGLFKIIE